MLDSLHVVVRLSQLANDIYQVALSDKWNIRRLYLNLLLNLTVLVQDLLRCRLCICQALVFSSRVDSLTYAVLCLAVHRSLYAGSSIVVCLAYNLYSRNHVCRADTLTKHLRIVCSENVNRLIGTSRYYRSKTFSRLHKALLLAFLRCIIQQVNDDV